jgi:hypothetical protein
MSLDPLNLILFLFRQVLLLLRVQRVRKRQSDDEDSGTSKLAADIPDETSEGEGLGFNPFDAAVGMSS